MLEELGDVRVVTQSLETVLQGPVPDQAALIGIINRLQGLGVELRGVRQLGTVRGVVRPGPGHFPREVIVRSYEIRVAGPIGPVVASALPGFVTVEVSTARACSPAP